jgi:osmotically-inducible protein OsmY
VIAVINRPSAIAVHLGNANRNTVMEIGLASRVRTFLAQQHLPGLTKIEVEAHGDTVRLSGQVRTFYERQMAIASCKRVAGVRQIDDRLVSLSRK